MAKRGPKRPGRPRSSERTREATRADLLDAAGQVFAAHGYRAATVAEIVAEAGLSKGTFYWHFRGKEDVFLALLEERFDRPVQALIEVTRSSPAEQTTAPTVSKGLFDLFEQRSELTLLLNEYWSAAVRDEKLKGRYQEHRTAMRDSLAQALAARMERTGLASSVSPDRLATAFLALGEGMARTRLVDPESVPADLYGEILSLVYDGLVARAGGDGKD